MVKTGQPAPKSKPELGGAVAPHAGGRRKDLYLLTGDDSLLLELGPLLGARFRTRPIDSADQLDQAGASPWLLIIDASARADARAQAARIEQRHPLAPLLVICPDGKTAEWASARARGVVCAVIERGALQSSALGEALAAAELRMTGADEAGTSSTMENLSWPGKPPMRRSLWLWLILASLFAAAAAWYFFVGRAMIGAPAVGSTAPAPAAAPTAIPLATTPPAAVSAAAVPASVPVVPSRTVLELLSDARVAFREGRNLLPRTDSAIRGDSAFELYAAVLAQEPQNDEALDGLRRLFALARTRIQTELAAGKLDEATRLLSSFRDAGIANAATAKLEADVAAARPRWLLAQTRTALANGDTETASQLIAQIAAGGGDRAVLNDLRRALESRNAEAQLNEIAVRARAAITSGALLEPAADNARTRVQAMQQLNRSHPLTVAVQRELQGALLARAQTAERAAQFEPAQQLLNAAAEYGNSTELASARRQLQSDVDAAQERTAVAAAARTPQVPAGAATEPQAEFVHARPVAPLNALYPQRALDAGQQGFVIVEFTLNVKGRASDPKVVESSPPAVFDAAALLAVKRGRYDTSGLGASGNPRRARLRITFRPTN